VQAAAPVTTRSSRREAIGLMLAPDGPGPLVVLIGGVLLVAIGAGLVAAHVSVFALDESLIQQSAVHYSSNLPHSLLHDLDARATNRLYSLVLSLAYRLTGGPDAVRIDHVLSVVMFVSAAFPIYIFGRKLLTSRWSAVAVALLSIALPWLTLSSALFTENLSYPVFWWVMLAVGAAVSNPAPVRDLVALLAIALLVGTRVQFAAMFVGYVLCLMAVSVWRSPSGRGALRRVGPGALEAARRFPFTIAILLVVLIGLAYARASGQWHAHVERLLGSYTNVVIRGELPPNLTEGVLVEVIALGLGVGLLPAIVSVPWYLRELARPSLSERWVRLAVTGAMLVVFLILTVYSQGGYLGNVTEERYFFYVVPVLWIGMFGALADSLVRPREILVSAAVLASLFATIPFLSPLNEENAFLAPVESVVPHVLTQRIAQLGLKGLTVQDALVVIALLAGLLLALVWARRGRLRGRLAVGASVLLQLLITGYAFATIDGKIQGIQGRTAGSITPLGWVDSAAGGGTVTWLEDLSVAQPPAIEVPAAGLAADQAHVTLFWNSQIRDAATVPSADPSSLEFPLSALPSAGAFSVRQGDGTLEPAALATKLRAVVEENGSPFLQLAGSVSATSPDGFLRLTRLSQPVRATWMTSGLQPDGYLTQGIPVTVRAWAPSPGGIQSELLVRFAFGAPPAPPGVARARTLLSVRLGAVRREVPLVSGSAAKSVSICARPAAGRLTGRIDASRAVPVEGRMLAAALERVSVSRVPVGSAACGRAQR
jgi:hypothetical protein